MFGKLIVHWSDQLNHCSTYSKKLSLRSNFYCRKPRKNQEKIQPCKTCDLSIISVNMEAVQATQSCNSSFPKMQTVNTDMLFSDILKFEKKTESFLEKQINIIKWI